MYSSALRGPDRPLSHRRFWVGLPTSRCRRPSRSDQRTSMRRFRSARVPAQFGHRATIATRAGSTGSRAAGRSPLGTNRWPARRKARFRRTGDGRASRLHCYPWRRRGHREFRQRHVRGRSVGRCVAGARGSPARARGSPAGARGRRACSRRFKERSPRLDPGITANSLLRGKRISALRASES